MSLSVLFYSLSGVVLLFFSVIYALVCVYLFYNYFVKGVQFFYLHRVFLAFVSFFMISLQQVVIHCFSVTSGIELYSLSQLSIKLFILTTLFLLLIFQSSGFVVDSMKIFMKYLSLLYGTILVVDVLSILIKLQKCYYNVLLSGIMVILILSLLWRFIKICMQRYDFIKESVRKENIVNVMKIAGVGFLASYTVFISAVSEGNGLISILVLLSLLVLHLYIVYKNCRPSTAVRSYVAEESMEESAQKLEVLEERCSDYQLIINRLMLYFESEKPYLDADLKIADVCKRIYTNKTYVSRALNHGMSKNFNQFVNYYRIKEACTIFIGEPITPLSELCDRCGFKNLSSFSNAFNLNVGYTPAEWCREVRKKLNNNEEVSIDDYFA